MLSTGKMKTTERKKHHIISRECDFSIRMIYSFHHPLPELNCTCTRLLNHHNKLWAFGCLCFIKHKKKSGPEGNIQIRLCMSFPLNNMIHTNSSSLSEGLAGQLHILSALLLGYLRLVSRATHLLNRIYALALCGCLFCMLSPARSSAALINKGSVQYLKPQSLSRWGMSQKTH